MTELSNDNPETARNSEKDNSCVVQVDIYADCEPVKKCLRSITDKVEKLSKLYPRGFSVPEVPKKGDCYRIEKMPSEGCSQMFTVYPSASLIKFSEELGAIHESTDG